MKAYAFGDVEIRPLTKSSVDENMAIELCRKVCGESNFEYGGFFEQYLDRSLYWGAYVRGELAGAIRVVTYSPDGLPCSEKKGWPLAIEDSSCELALVALDKRFRGDNIFIYLFVAFYWWCLENGVDTVYAILNKIIFRLYQMIGIPFAPVGETKLYWNDPSFPAKLVLSELPDSVKAKRPDLWKIVEEAR